NSSTSAQARKRPPKARSRSVRCASEILPPRTAPSPTQTASRSQGCAAGFAKTTWVSTDIALLGSRARLITQAERGAAAVEEALRSRRCAESVRHPLGTQGKRGRQAPGD